MNNFIKTIMGVLCSVLLCAIIVFECKFLFNQITHRNDDIYEATVIGAMDSAHAQVSIDKVYEYPEVYDEVYDLYKPEGVLPVDYVPIWETGDVLSVGSFAPNIRLSGIVSDTSDAYMGVYPYIVDGNKSAVLHVYTFYTGIDSLREGIVSYWNEGDHSTLLTWFGKPWQEEAITDLQETFKGTRYPAFYNSSSKDYIVFIDTDDTVYALSSEYPFFLTDELATPHFADPHNNYLAHHNYSFYETFAAENTLNELNEKDKDGNTQQPTYTQQGVQGTDATYTSPSDDTIRKQLASYSKYQWKKDGTADGTSLVIDTKSDDALKSQWTLTATTYGYSNAGLTISGMNASRSSDSFEISCNINNTIDAQRPYVVVFKYINAEGELLGISVKDSRGTPLDSKGVARISFTVDNSSLNGACSDIVAVQVEAY